jgi:hypothetical protein
LLPRQRTAVALKTGGAAALIPGYVFVAPPSRWEDPVLLAVLGVLAVIAFRSVVRLPSGVGFDAMDALALLTVALLGPLPALAIIVAPWLDKTFVRGGESSATPWFLTLPGYLGTYGWQAIAAALLLQAAGVHDPTAPAAMGWLLAAGAVLYTVAWVTGPAIYVPLWVGQPLRAACRAYVDMLPAAALMLVLGAATVVLSGPLGVLALLAFALIAVLPQSALTYAARSRPVARLDCHTATRRYVHALAVQLRLPRRERRHVDAVVASARARPPTGDALDYVCAMLEDPGRANYEAQVITEWWNGLGAPLNLRGEEIPLAARLVAVAQTWAALTAKDTPELGHDEALDHLRSVAGVRLDPSLVSAARAVIGQELVTAEQPAPEPRLHHLHVPARLRRALTASATTGSLTEG